MWSAAWQVFVLLYLGFSQAVLTPEFWEQIYGPFLWEFISAEKCNENSTMHDYSDSVVEREYWNSDTLGKKDLWFKNKQNS